MCVYVLVPLSLSLSLSLTIFSSLSCSASFQSRGPLENSLSHHTPLHLLTTYTHKHTHTHTHTHTPTHRCDVDTGGCDSKGTYHAARKHSSPAPRFDLSWQHVDNLILCTSLLPLCILLSGKGKDVADATKGPNWTYFSNCVLFPQLHIRSNARWIQAYYLYAKWLIWDPAFFYGMPYRK